jgi:hypothetical protein
MNLVPVGNHLREIEQGEHISGEGELFLPGGLKIVMKTPGGNGNAAPFVISVNAGRAVFRLPQEFSAESEDPGRNSKPSEKIPTNHYVLHSPMARARPRRRC